MSDFVPERIAAVLAAPAWMDHAEKTLIYGFVAARRPRRILELRTQEGGATAVMCAALDDVGAGRILTVDAQPGVDASLWEMIEHRVTQFATLPEALGAETEPIDLVLLYHHYVPEEIIAALDAIVPELSKGAHILVHDAHLDPVRDAVDGAVARHEGLLVDAGLLATAVSTERRPGGGTTNFGGLRLLFYAGV